MTDYLYSASACREIDALAIQALQLEEMQLMKRAAKAGALIHTLAGDSIAKRRSRRGLIAPDIVEELPEIFKMIEQSK